MHEDINKTVAENTENFAYRYNGLCRLYLLSYHCFVAIYNTSLQITEGLHPFLSITRPVVISTFTHKPGSALPAECVIHVGIHRAINANRSTFTGRHQYHYQISQQWYLGVRCVVSPRLLGRASTRSRGAQYPC